jgi:hypothetical protein
MELTQRHVRALLGPSARRTLRLVVAENARSPFLFNIFTAPLRTYRLAPTCNLKPEIRPQAVADNGASIVETKYDLVVCV